MIVNEKSYQTVWMEKFEEVISSILPFNLCAWNATNRDTTAAHADMTIQVPASPSAQPPSLCVTGLSGNPGDDGKHLQRSPQRYRRHKANRAQPLLRRRKVIKQ